MLSCAAGATAHPAAAFIQRSRVLAKPWPNEPAAAAAPGSAARSSDPPAPAKPSEPAPVAPRPTTLTPEEEARAAELEAQIVSEERQAEQAQRRARDRQQRAADRDPVVRSTVPLSVREAEEYAYVARDVRRIATIAAGLFAIMIGLWIALQVSGVGAI